MGEDYDYAQRLLDTLSEIHRGTSTDAQVTSHLRRNLVAFGSASDDNVNCAKALKIRTVRSPYIDKTKVRQLMLKSSGLAMSDVVDAIESLPLLPEVKQMLPELSESEWRATLRFLALVLVATERDIPIKRSTRTKVKRTKPKK